ncbi:hypothetical protein EST38_g5226 [Candolleomyces aberdarensis]|uniref:F-box domain-containing protein n=1 Tax=Candolleomyces aberdarensis TaxID=2316362 RepID=A0A4Q2DKK4_9AGAR|nr:hypothetical protein EST38_g5226 [Candolleomyces aberdarensis]
MYTRSCKPRPRKADRTPPKRFPILRLPQSVILNILSLAKPRYYTKRGRRRQASICLTCRQFKDIVYQHPSFWTTLSFLFEDISKFSSCAPFVDSYFSRAGSRRLTLELEVDEPEEDVRDSVAAEAPGEETQQQYLPGYLIFPKYSGRWTRLHFKTVPAAWVNALDQYLREKGASDCFKEVLDYACQFSNLEPLRLQEVLLKDMPNVDKLDILVPVSWTDTIDFRLEHAPIWPNLSELSIGLYAHLSTHLQILRECSGLQELLIRKPPGDWHVDNDFEVDDIWQDDPILLPNLTTFALLDLPSNRALVQSFTAPRLTKLFIQAEDPQDDSTKMEWPFHYDIMEFQTRSGFSLRDLEIHYLGITDESMVNMLVSMPTLERLFYRNYKATTWFLFYADEMGGLPRLKTLEIVLHNYDANMSGVYEDFVNSPSRWWSDEKEAKKKKAKNAKQRKGKKPKSVTRVTKLEDTYLFIPLHFDDDTDSETDSQDLPSYPIANVPVFRRGFSGPEFTVEQEDEDLLDETDEDENATGDNDESDATGNSDESDATGDGDESDAEVVEDDGDNEWSDED